MEKDPYRYFRVEARELVEQLGQGVLELERGGGADVVARLLRQAHTLKGAARVVRQAPIAERSHEIEDALAPLREGGAPTREIVARVLALVDAIAVQLAALGTGAGSGAPTEARAEARAPARPAPELAPIVRAELGELDALRDGVHETSRRLGPLHATAAELEIASRLAESLVASLAPHGRETDRRAILAEQLRAAVRRCERELRAGLEQAGRELGQVREAAEQLRLAPASTLFPVLERTARDAAQALDRQVAFEARGGDVRLDPSLLATLQNALVQLVRNAVAHGIAPAAERRRAGKPPQGRVVVEVARRHGRTSFACRDDGRGLDLEAVRRVAVARGLATAGTDRAGDIVALLLRGGISTSAKVTEVAGRGIGLDVVREAVERLHGEVRVETTAGGGTSFELLVPVSLASTEVLLVESGGARVAVPLDAVRATRRIGRADVSRTASGETVVHDGRTLPFVQLASVLGGAAAPGGDAWAEIVIEGGSGQAALGVERLAGIATAVVHTLPAAAAADPVVGGATLDADGVPQLVLDPDGLVAAARRVRAPEAPPPATRTAVLIVDDSLTTRMLEQSILESAGYEVDTATSGEDGLEAARRKRYALFLVDVEMPGIDGFTFIERVRADPALRDTPAILVTSRADAQDFRRGEQAGAQGYVVKGEFDQRALLAHIERLVH